MGKEALIGHLQLDHMNEYQNYLTTPEGAELRRSQIGKRATKPRHSMSEQDLEASAPSRSIEFVEDYPPRRKRVKQ